MYRLILILLLSFSSYSQEYAFNTIDKRTSVDWEIRPISGYVKIEKDFIEVITYYNHIKLDVIGRVDFYKMKERIYTCKTQSDESVNIRIHQDGDDTTYIEMYWYSDKKDEKYFRFCLEKCSL